MVALLSTIGVKWLTRHLAYYISRVLLINLADMIWLSPRSLGLSSIVRDEAQVSIIRFYMATVEVDLTPVLKSSQRLTAIRRRKLGLVDKIKRMEPTGGADLARHSAFGADSSV